MHEVNRRRLRILHAGSGDRTLLLLHGLGATADVWEGLVGELAAATAGGRWRVLAPDLPGHGGSAALERYGVGTLAAALVPVLDPDDDITVLGHSLGGAVAVALASGWFGVRVRRAVAVGVKVGWSAEELAKAAAVAARPAPAYAERSEALARHLRVCGLGGLIGADDPRLAAGITRTDDGSWSLRLDQAAFGVGDPAMAGLVAAARSEVVLARGELDPMVSDAELTAFGRQPVVLPGLGHNAHVEEPAALLDLVG